jgi:uncharacterized MAPEG superfamily protein
MNLVDAAAMLAVLQYILFGTLVANARGKFGVKAPAVAGNEQFERRYRAHINTLELLVILFPSAYAAARYLPHQAVAAAVLLFVVGRFIYWRAYIADPATRSFGFTLSILPVIALALSTLAAVALGKGAA